MTAPTGPAPGAQVASWANKRQREAARPDVSAWVSASAGSGKTKVLIDRVLALLLAGAEPGKLLCLTFTKAAAAEMANRLADRLAGWATASDDALAGEIAPLLREAPSAEDLARARRLFAEVLDTPGGMKIQTIHAFCQSILGRFPLEAGVPPHFRVADERSAAELLAAAREESVAGPDSLDEALTAVAAHAQEGRFTELLAELLRERGRLARAIAEPAGLRESLAALRRLLGIAPGETRAALLEAGCADDALDLMGLRLALDGLGQGGKTDRERAAAIARWLEADRAGRIAGLEDYLEAFFTKTGEPRARLITRPGLAAAPGADAVLNQEAQRLFALRAGLRAHAVLEATSALLTVGRAVLAAYGRHKRARALLDYDDLILLSRDLLTGRADWVLYKLDGGLDHVLIDEAQDTNPEQWQVVAALTGEFFAGEGRAEAPRTVFAVGDAKQSIYGFQRADPEGFARMRDHYAERVVEAHQVMREVPLDVSFRSTAAVLDVVDRVFAQPGAAEGLFLGEEALRHSPVRGGQAGLVELWPPADPLEPEEIDPWQPPPAEAGRAGAPQPPVVRLARLIARRIWHWTRDPAWAERPEAWLASKDRRLRPGDVMVLVRRRNVFVEALVRALKALDVPVAGIDRMVLTEQLAVMDLITLGRVLLLPQDDLTLACVLKGPLIGLDEDALFALAHERAGTLWDALAERRAERPDFAAAAAFLAGLMARVDYLRPFELYAEVLGAGGGRRRLVGRLGLDANDPIDEFLALALAYERDRVPSLEGFLHWLEAGGQEVKRDLEHGGGAVRIMTVHGAKGLQAPLVILPDSLQTPQSDRGLLWLAPERDPQQILPLWPLTRAYDGEAAAAARERAARAREREYRRLLYVAMTRAEDRLYVCGWNTTREPPEGCWYNMVARALEDYAESVAYDFSGEVEGGWAGPGWRLATVQAASPERDEAPERAAWPLEPLPPWAREVPGPEPSPPRPLAPSRPASEEPVVASPLAGARETRFRRGLLIHRLLQHLPALEPARREAAGARFLAQPLHGLDPAEQAEILAESLALLEHPETRALFGPGSLAEVPLTGVVEGRGGPFVVSGQVDRLLVGDQSVLVIDYKTNREPPAGESDAPTAYLRQMAGYRAVLAGVFPDRPIRCLLLWTVGPRIMQLSDALLAGHAP